MFVNKAGHIFGTCFGSRVFLEIHEAEPAAEGKPESPLLPIRAGCPAPLVPERSVYKMSSKIQDLTGHSRRFFGYLGVSTVLFFIGGFFAYVGDNSDAMFLRNAGVGIAAFGVLGILLCFRFADRARCPICKSKMEQGWDRKEEGLDGVFECPKCHAKWRTAARWNLGD